MNKALKIGLPIVAVVLIGAGAYAVLGEDDSQSESKTETSQTEPVASSDSEEKPATQTKPQTQSPDTSTSNQKAGRYTAYSSSELSANGYDTNVVFFFAPWCPECRAFKEAINASSIPDGVQVLETDFDSSTELKSKYGVTLQSTFVKVSDNGDQQSKYVGYGKDKSLSSVLSNL